MDPKRFPNGLEVRAAVELRAAGRRLEGLAAVFGTETRIGGFTEFIRPGAFAASLRSGNDVLARFVQVGPLILLMVAAINLCRAMIR